MGQKGACPRSRDLLFKCREPLISLEHVKVKTLNFARGLKVRDRILNKTMQNWSKREWPRSRATSRSRELLNVGATEALRNG